MRGTPPAWPPQPTFPCLLCCSGHPTLGPGNVPPAPMIRHVIPRGSSRSPQHFQANREPRTGQGSAGQGRGGPGTHTCREPGAVERGKSNKRPGWNHSSIPNTRMLDGPAAASSTPAQFPTDKGGQARPGQASIPRKTRGAGIPREANPESLRKRRQHPWENTGLPSAGHHVLA